MTKYLERSYIEEQAFRLLQDYSKVCGPVPEPPIPIDAICESHLGLELSFDNLRDKYGPSVLAATYILDKTVVVDEHLVPDDYPDQEGRYRFTLAHECGHWILHRGEYIATSKTPDLFGEVREPVVCRSSSKERHEIQADMFAAALLMPEDMVREQWRGLGQEGCYEAYAELMHKQPFGPEQSYYSEDEYEPPCDISIQMASIFHVSKQAMQIRLKDLGLIRTEKPIVNQLKLNLAGLA